MLKQSYLERDPKSLQRLLLLLGLVSMALILTLSGIGIYRASTDTVLRGAEDDAKRIATVMVSQQYKFLFSEGEKNISLNSQQLSYFDRQAKDFLHPFGIVKIKVFDLNRIIIYSTDSHIIGMLVENNPRLEKALRGDIDSHQETKDRVVDLAEEQLLDVDVVETYLPVYNASGQLAGSFELYLDVTHYRNEITHRVTSSLLILATILLGVFLLSFIVVRMGVQQLQSLHSRLRQMAVTDPLTGALNRGEILHRAEQELSRMERREKRKPAFNLGVIMLDLDHFKLVNDTYGHLCGDEVLREMTQRVCSSLREYDTYGRYGGEEFLLLIPDCEFEGAMLAAERILLSLSASPFIFNQHALQITASLGVTCCYDPKEGFDAALQRADDALYHAKDSGRNRVSGFRAEETPVINLAAVD